MPSNIGDIVNQAIKQWQNNVPMRKCDVCGLVRRQDSMINFAMIVGSPGHPELPAFQCQHTEHWACSLAHFSAIVEHCAHVEVKNMLAHMHAVILPSQGVQSIHYDESIKHLTDQGVSLEGVSLDGDHSTIETYDSTAQ